MAPSEGLNTSSWSEALSRITAPSEEHARIDAVAPSEGLNAPSWIDPLSGIIAPSEEHARIDDHGPIERGSMLLVALIRGPDPVAWETPSPPR